MRLTTFKYANPTKLIIGELSKHLTPAVSTLRAFIDDDVPEVSEYMDAESVVGRPVETRVMVQLVDTTSSTQPTKTAELLLTLVAPDYNGLWETQQEIERAMSLILISNDNPVAFYDIPEAFSEEEVQRGFCRSVCTLTVTLLPDETTEVPLF